MLLAQPMNKTAIIDIIAKTAMFFAIFIAMYPYLEQFDWSLINVISYLLFYSTVKQEQKQYLTAFRNNFVRW